MTTISITPLGGSASINFTPGSILFADANGTFGQKNANLFWDNTNFRLGIGTASPLTQLHVAGSIRLSGTSQDTFITPGSLPSNVGTKINIPIFDPGAFGQVMAMGIQSTSSSSSRVASFFDARTVTHQPTLAVFSPNENDILGLSWNGSNTQGFVQTLTNNLGLKVSTDNPMVEVASGNKLGLFGVTPVVKPLALTVQLTTITYTPPGTPTYTIANITNASPFGFATADQGNTVLSVIENLQTRIADLETKLRSVGILT